MSRRLVPGFTNLYIDEAGALFAGTAADYSAFSPSGSLTMAGHARVARHWYVPAGAFVKQGAADPDQGWEGLYETQDFAAAIEQSLYYDINVPYRWADATDIHAHVFWLHDANAADAAKFVRWGVAYKSVAAGEALVGAGVSITQDQANLDASQGLLLLTSFVAPIPAAALAAHGQLGIRFYRDATADDMPGDARLIEVHFEFIMDKLGKPA